MPPVLRERTPAKGAKVAETPTKASSVTKRKSSKESIDSQKISKPIHYEFGGPIGATGVVIGLPVVIWGLFFLCNKDICVENPLAFDWVSWASNHLPSSLSDLYSHEAAVMYLGWMVFHIFLERVLPGENVS